MDMNFFKKPGGISYHTERYILFVERTIVTTVGPPMAGWFESSYTVIQHKNASSKIMKTISPTSINYATIREWLQVCNQDHSSRCASGSQILPTGFRLIDCKRHRVVDVDTLSTTPEYIALSYVWGRTTWRILDQTNDSSGSLKLPQVIEDALTITLKLGFHYVWVDRYCIDQDSQDLKMAQINSMDIIYSSAQATIVAAAGDGPHVGLPGVGVMRLLFETRGVGRSMPSVQLEYSSQIITSFQETLLSQRRIVFTNEQVYFQCRKACSCESYPVRIDADISLSPLDRFYEFAFQTEPFHKAESVEIALRDFTRRQLRYNADTLNVFRGIMKQYTQKLGIHFFYGLPLRAQPVYEDRNEYVMLPEDSDSWTLKQRLTTALTWNSHIREDIQMDKFPSWSWAGWKWPMKELKDSSFLWNYYCSSAKTTIYTASGDPIVWDELEYEFPDECKLSPMITLHAWACPVKLLRFGSWYAPKGKGYECQVARTPFPPLCRFFPYEGRWSWKPVDYTAIYLGPPPRDIKKPMATEPGPAVFFMLIKERVDGKWERAGEGEGYWCDIRNFFAWRNDLVQIPGVFERRKFDLV